MNVPLIGCTGSPHCRSFHRDVSYILFCLMFFKRTIILYQQLLENKKDTFCLKVFTKCFSHYGGLNFNYLMLNYYDNYLGYKPLNTHLLPP